MRKIFILLIVFSYLQGGFAMILPNYDLFERLAITIPAKEKAQYIYGDNIAGYFEGYTHDYQKGQGYVMVNAAVYKDFGSYINGILNNRKENASFSKIYPWGSRTYFNSGVYEEFMMHAKKYAVSIALHSPNPAKLSLIPILTSRKSKLNIKQKDGILLLSPQKPSKTLSIPQYIAISANAPYDIKELNKETSPELKNPLRVNSMMYSGQFTSKKALTDFRLYIAFGFTETEAFHKAQNMSKQKAEEVNIQSLYNFLTASYLWTDDEEYNRALMWAKVGAYAMVQDEFGKGIWAGLPWFKQNWGRDTFISLPGTLIVTGMFDESKEVLTHFSSFQNKGQIVMEISGFKDNEEKKAIKNYLKNNWGTKMSFKGNSIFYSVSRYYIDHPDELKTKIEEMSYKFPNTKIETRIEYDKNIGRIPNRVASLEDIIYNTTDGTPWFIREVYEYIRYTGDIQYAKEIYSVVKLALDGAISNYVDKMGFLTHDDADTWMDARIAGGAPWSARGNRAVDIQVLWFTALHTGAFLANYVGDIQKANEWLQLAKKLQENFPKLFWNSANKILADRVRKDDTPDYKMRPNQLMVVSVPFDNRLVDHQIEAYIVKNAIGELLYPWGIASLSQNHPYFHPYHEKWELYHKDSAYHNGTVWGWNAGFTITAMTRYGYTDLAYQLATNLSYQILYMGCRGNMSELVNAFPQKNGEIKLSGTYAQAWSVAEFSRNGYQDFVGFRPNLIENKITLMPAIPSAWNQFYASLAFGDKGKFLIDFKREGSMMVFEVSFTGYSKQLTLEIAPSAADKTRYAVEIAIKEGQKRVVKFDTANGSFEIDGKPANSKVYLKSYANIIGELKFQQPNLNKKYPVLEEKDWLKNVIESGKFQ